MSQNRTGFTIESHVNHKQKMKALILVGGYGTRLRPLTLTVPKPLIEFCNSSILEHQIKALVEAGVHSFIMAVAYKTEAMMTALKQLERKFDITIKCSIESEPLGTAGPIKLADSLLREGETEEDSFFVLNSDIICSFPLKQMLEFHRKQGGIGTILITRVENPSLYGVVISEGDRIKSFTEKPTEFISDEINAGIYLLKIKSLSLFRVSLLEKYIFKMEPSSIEREIFPLIAKLNELYKFDLEGYWADIGQPGDFLRGIELYLTHDKHHVNSFGPGIGKNVLIHPTAKVGDNCLLGPNVTIGANCIIGMGVRLSNTAVFSGVKIDSFCLVSNCVIGWGSILGEWSRIEGLSVLGENVKIDSECFINQAIILPHKHVTSGIFEPGKILM